jgi:hypothetical protein
MDDSAADRRLARLVRRHRHKRKRWRAAASGAIGAALCLGFLPGAMSGDAARPAIPIELFTSQSCSSCPPAEALFRDIARREDVVALEWHVDYWNDLDPGAAGRWRDPFSSRENSHRQRAYNVALRGTPSVYTPQIVIDGAYEAIGSQAERIEELIEIAKSRSSRAVVVAHNGAFEVRTAPPGSTALLVTFKRTAQTRVRAGENVGKDLSEHHVVVETKVLGPAASGDRFEAPSLGPDYGCALLLVDQGSTVTVGAAYCADLSRG